MSIRDRMDRLEKLAATEDGRLKIGPEIVIYDPDGKYPAGVFRDAPIVIRTLDDPILLQWRVPPTVVEEVIVTTAETTPDRPL